MPRTTTTTDTRNTTATVSAALTVLLLVPGLLAGCTGTAGTTTSPTSATSRSAAPDAGAVGDCMRSKGYDFDDDELGIGGGGSSAKVSAPDGVDAQRWATDLLGCSGVDERAGAGGAATAAPGSAEAERKTVACIRDNGFPDYPDGDDERRSYRPADQDAFDRVAQDCDDEADEWSSTR